MSLCTLTWHPDPLSSLDGAISPTMIHSPINSTHGFVHSFSHLVTIQMSLQNPMVFSVAKECRSVYNLQWDDWYSVTSLDWAVYPLYDEIRW